jgi:hypothetical protein
VRACVAKESDDKVFFDAMAWMKKMLAASGQAEYRPTVELVAEKATSRKLRSYVDKYLSSYY